MIEKRDIVEYNKDYKRQFFHYPNLNDTFEVLRIKEQPVLNLDNLGYIISSYNNKATKFYYIATLSNNKTININWLNKIK